MWIAREENGLLRLYTKKPYRYYGGIWRIPNDGDCITISDEEYPQYKSITWESEPLEVFLYSKKECTQYDSGFDDGYKKGYDAALYGVNLEKNNKFVKIND